MSTARVRCPVSGPFHADLKRRVEAYFSGRTPHGGWHMRVKTAVLLAWLGGTWAVAMFVPVSGAQAALLAVSVGLAMAGVGFSVMHDANHGSYSKDPRVNRVLSFTLDLLGASSHLWRQKHNILHHTYTNIAGLDDDIESGTPHLRFAPWQRHRFFHRFQHLYVWLLYGLFPLKWFFIDDFRQFVTGRIGTQRFPAARGWPLATALLGKAVFFAWAFVLPALLHPTWWLIPLWLLASFTLGNEARSQGGISHQVGCSSAGNTNAQAKNTAFPRSAVASGHPRAAGKRWVPMRPVTNWRKSSMKNHLSGNKPYSSQT